MATFAVHLCFKASSLTSPTEGGTWDWILWNTCAPVRRFERPSEKSAFDLTGSLLHHIMAHFFHFQSFPVFHIAVIAFTLPLPHWGRNVASGLQIVFAAVFLVSRRDTLSHCGARHRVLRDLAGMPFSRA